MEYGYRPSNDGSRTTLLTGAAALTGIFALGKGLRGRVNKLLKEEFQSAISGANKDLLSQIGTTGSSVRLAEYLSNEGIAPNVTSLQALKFTMARSRAMGWWEKGAGLFKPLELFDNLSFLRAMRESYGSNVSQVRYLGAVEDLSIFGKTGRFPEEFAKKRDRPVFYAWGHLYANHDGTIVPIAGKYRLFGRAAPGEAASSIERNVSELLGDNSTVSQLHERLDYIKLSIEKLRKLELGGQLDKAGAARLKRLEHEEKSTRRVVRRLQSTSAGARFARTFDMGLNTRESSMFSKQYWREWYSDRVGGILHPSDVTINRSLDPDRPFDVVHAFEFNKRGLKNAFFGGRDGQINAATIGLYHLYARINRDVLGQGIGSWFALSARSTTFTPYSWIPGIGGKEFGGPAAFYANIATKRLLPISAAMFYTGYANDVVGHLTGERASDRSRDLRAHLDLWWAGFKDRLGITKRVRDINELSGGFLGYLAHPFVETPVGLSKSELADFQAHGEVAVRKGRWWSFGSSTAFRGERVNYFSPYYTRWAKAGDVYDTSTLWGSPGEKYANAALPTPTHPLSFLRHFFTDRYHYEKKHYYDRPYPVSAPLFEPTSVHGAILNPLLGWLLKPQQHYHQDDLPYIIDGPHRGERNPRYRGELRSLNEQIKEKARRTELTGFVTPGGSIEPMAAISLPGSDREIASVDDNDIPDYDPSVGQLSGGVTPQKYLRGGSAGKQNRRNIKGIIEKIKIASRFTKGRMLEPAIPPGLFGNQDPNDPRARARLLNPQDPHYQGGLAYYSLTEIGGIYGFGSVTLTGDLYANRPTLADAGRMTGFERTYWDRWNLGGMAPTPGMSEAFRRFLPHRFHSNTIYNPIRNTMPTWLPGSGGEDPAYFVDFLHGDPYTTVPNGEVRLPGEAYERLHGISALPLKLRSTQVGYDQEMLYGFLTGAHEPFAAYSEEIGERSDALHRAVLRQLHPLQKEVFYTDNIHNVSGEVDALIGDEHNPTAVQIHTLSSRRFSALSDAGDERYKAQLNFDMAALHIKQGKLIYVNRETGEQREQDLQFNAGLYQHTLHNIQSVRARIDKEYRHGQWATGQFYDDLTKLRILADVAPWSQQYKRYRDYLVHLDQGEISPEDRAELKRIKEEVTERKHRFRMTPFRTKYAGLTYQNVRVKDVIDNQTFTTYEYPDNPIRLAGVHIAADTDMTPFIHPGAHLRVGYASDQTQRVAHDTLHTIRSVVFKDGQMINRLLIERGMASETDENTPAGMHVRYTDSEFKWASFFEHIGHANIPIIHNKYLPLDSPLDLYKRTQVYGKDWQDWRHPFKDYLFPSYESAAQQGLMGMLVAGFLGWGLTTGKNTKLRGKIAAVSALATLVLAHKRKQDPIPDYRRRERDVQEYFDILKYIKYEGLYEKTRSWVKQHQHHDIGMIADKYKNEGEKRKRRIQVLKQEKRNIIVSGHGKRDHARILEINHEIHELQSYRAQLNLSREDILALQYRNMAETTLYGAEPGGDMRKVLLALNPKEREFFQAFLKAAGPEREQILKLVPDNERRFLESAYGMKAEERPRLSEYFQTHYLPPADWNGWKANSDLDDYKLVVMKQEGLDMTTHGFWPQDEERVREENIPDIRPRRRTPGDVHAQLHHALSGMGLRNIDIQIEPSMHGQDTTTMRIRHSRRQEIDNYQGNSV